MRELFQADMKALGDQLEEIAGLVRRAIEQARTAFETADVELAETVISEDARIDYLQNTLDEKAIELLLLQSPVATDLRTLVAALRMSSSLERTGDLARHIAQLTRLRYPEHVVPESRREAFKALADNTVEVAVKLDELLKTHDLDLTREIVKLNTEIDEIHEANFAAIADPSWEGTPYQTADVTLASRYFERIADHSVSIARKVAYLVTGEWEPNVASAE
ncbi:phosphate signaling complex protein PhoU [Auritidibacter ignavus]|uniref:phosphate signaling complex protein PhoU n=1 Tax=Auritidibacter ignavus TaxID=678932 RepID=UPI002449950E|nr:phosphate signaling complex protein PhoU [Auritidibacter ignavus]WGH85030.1 phosphate signaling complex protein PhoU [Auritidibacter ignavus]WGH89824.1 phosphate signaling complex protein PhoU [Auritidibacter ignavus]WHS27224.1 phosphate signaling complex protein PhoU [Auritidibacter ignavus]